MSRHYTAKHRKRDSLIYGLSLVASLLLSSLAVFLFFCGFVLDSWMAGLSGIAATACCGIAVSASMKAQERMEQDRVL